MATLYQVEVRALTSKIYLVIADDLTEARQKAQLMFHNNNEWDVLHQLDLFIDGVLT
jgi:hypothetical protein